MLQVMKQEFTVYDHSRDLGHSERRLHVIANQMLSYNYFVISSSIFQNLFALLAKEKAFYYRSPFSLIFITTQFSKIQVLSHSFLPTSPPALNTCVELVLIRTKVEGEQPVYRVYDKATGEFRLSAIFSPECGEYIISASKSMKNIQLYNDAYVGGIRFVFLLFFLHIFSHIFIFSSSPTPFL